jgi:hypothetical protein
MSWGRRAAGRSADMGVDDKDFAREALDGFFRRRGQARKFYCAACLAQRLTQRGVGAFPPVAVKAAVADAFERPGLLRLKPRGRCGACKKARPSIGVSRAGAGPPP